MLILSLKNQSILKNYHIQNVTFKTQVQFLNILIIPNI